MKVSQLQLRYYNLVKAHIEPREPLSLDIPDASFFSDWDGVNVGSGIQFAWADGQGDDPRNFALGLAITVKNDGEKKAPYNVDVACTGYFDLIGDLSRIDRHNFARINGASVLYGVLREFLYATSARFPFGGMLLPTVTFIDLEMEAPIQVTSAATDK